MVDKKRHWLVGAVALLGVTSASADNFLQVYRDALKNDPTFKEAQATWLSTKQNLPIATSQLLPTFDITAGVNRNYIRTKVTGPIGYFNSNNYGVSVTEQVFNWGNWMAISGAKSQVKSATATYLAALQDLMGRVSQAYFNVLIAASELRFTIAQKNAIWQQYVQSEQKYKVGLIAITPVYDAQAQYDIAVSTEISNRNAVDNALENLRAITGKLYSNLAALGERQVPLYIPTPQNIDSWTQIALKQNWSLIAQKYLLMYDRRIIQQTAAGNYPTVDAAANWGTTNYNHAGLNLSKNNTTAAAIGLSLDFPFYQGGLISAQTKQAEYNYLNDSAGLLFQHRQVISLTRQAYLGIIAGISGVKADRQSVISNENSLNATKAGYAVGTRTMVDLLQALSQLYSAQRTYAQDQYNYILSIVSLKQQAGTLSEKDITKINSWLTENEPLIKKKFNNSYTPSTPPTNLKVQGQPVDLEPSNNAPRVLPGGGRSGDMPRITNQTIGYNDIKRDHYTVQLYASNNRGSAQAYIIANQLVGKAHILSTKDSKQPAYKVVIGDYSSFRAANTARKQLPKKLRKQHPWVTHVSAAQHHRLASVSSNTSTSKSKPTAKPAAKPTVVAKAKPVTAVKAKPTTVAEAPIKTKPVKPTIKQAKPNPTAIAKGSTKPNKAAQAATSKQLVVAQGELQLPTPT